MRTVRLYHRTDHGETILREGFRDASGFYGTTTEWTGVWLSDTPLDGNEGAKGDDLLTVEIQEIAIADYEWIEDGKTYREWLVPARIVNLADRVLLAPEPSAAYDPDPQVMHDFADTISVLAENRLS